MSRLKNGWVFKNNLNVKTNIIIYLYFFIVKIHLIMFMVNRKILKKNRFKIDRNKSKDKSKVWEL